MLNFTGMSRCTRHRDAYPRRIDKLYEGTALGSTGIPACATSCYLRNIDETRKPKNAFFDLAGVVRVRCVVTLAQAGMPVLLKRPVQP